LLEQDDNDTAAIAAGNALRKSLRLSGEDETETTAPKPPLTAVGTVDFVNWYVVVACCAYAAENAIAVASADHLPGINLTVPGVNITCCLINEENPDAT